MRRRRNTGNNYRVADVARRYFDNLKCWLDVDRQLIEDFARANESPEYLGVYQKTEPLVSVCVTTYNRAHLLAERCIPSVLSQTYPNFELIIVGDCCTDDTASVVSAFNDHRVTFVNLRERGKYPEHPRLRWMVAGTQSVNHALELARGDFITHLDDDDEYMPQRIEKLVRFIMDQQLDLVWHPFYAEAPDGAWHIRDSDSLKFGGITTSSSFYHRWFARVPWDINAYKLLEPGDWNRFRKFRYLGVRAERYPEPLLRHYRERNQQAGGARR